MVPGFSDSAGVAWPVLLPAQTTLANKTGLWRYLTPRYLTRPSPCQVNCPVGQDVRGWLTLIQDGRLQEASELVRRDNPFPSVCGRVCYHPCEDHCNRRDFDEAIAIHEVERFIGDYGLNVPVQRPERRQEGLKVAIVGSGPAGLACAYHLSKKGYQATIFEARSVVGGMLAIGIPQYRLPKEIVQKEIQRIVSQGVEIRTGLRIGLDFTLDDLLREGYRAVFLAIGAQQSRKLGISNESATGVTSGLDFLREVNGGKGVALGDPLAVIGGGNVAVDAARVARRLGARNVTIFYRRSREEMLASPAELEAAETEGVRLEYLTAPVMLLESKGKLIDMQLLRMKLGEPDASGRRQPVPIEGSEFSMPVGGVILAVGQEVELSSLGGGGNVQVADGLLMVDPESLATSRQGVFAGGDAVTGPATVAQAIGAGKKAAASIDRYLHVSSPAAVAEMPAIVDDLNLDYFVKQERITGKCLSPAERIDSFAEVEQGCSQEQIIAEASRCFSCGLCRACDNCWLFCPEVCVSNDGAEYHINYDYCKGCGICVEECPTGALIMEV